MVCLVAILQKKVSGRRAAYDRVQIILHLWSRSHDFYLVTAFLVDLCYFICYCSISYSRAWKSTNSGKDSLRILSPYAIMYCL